MFLDFYYNRHTFDIFSGGTGSRPSLIKLQTRQIPIDLLITVFISHKCSFQLFILPIVALHLAETVNASLKSSLYNKNQTNKQQTKI
ncbi:hypothetical protein NUACC26_059590 [Scytonema sp. NUACC26]